MEPQQDHDITVPLAGLRPVKNIPRDQGEEVVGEWKMANMMAKQGVKSSSKCSLEVSLHGMGHPISMNNSLLLKIANFFLLLLCLQSSSTQGGHWFHSLFSLCILIPRSQEEGPTCMRGGRCRSLN